EAPIPACICRHRDPRDPSPRHRMSVRPAVGQRISRPAWRFSFYRRFFDHPFEVTLTRRKPYHGDRGPFRLSPEWFELGKCGSVDEARSNYSFRPTLPAPGRVLAI